MPHIAVDDTSTATFPISGRKLTTTTYVGFFHDTSIYPDAPMHLSYAMNTTNFPGFHFNNANSQFTFSISSLPAAVRPSRCLVRPALLVLSGGPRVGTDHAVEQRAECHPDPVPGGLLHHWLARASPATSLRDSQACACRRVAVVLAADQHRGRFKLPLTLSVRPGASVASGPRECFPSSNQSTSNPPPVVYSGTTGSSSPLAKTNCVDTDTGLTSNAATAALFGTSGPVGRLVKNGGKTSTAPYNPGHTCDFDASSQSKTFSSPPKTVCPFNNDILTCFMTDPNMPLSTITSASYNGPPVLSEAIYSSPRFFCVPVFGTKPANGGSHHYSILDMRPAFLTDSRYVDAGELPRLRGRFGKLPYRQRDRVQERRRRPARCLLLQHQGPAEHAWQRTQHRLIRSRAARGRVDVLVAADPLSS